MVLKVYIVFIALLFVSCDPSSRSEIIENHPDGSPKARKTFFNDSKDSTKYLFEELYKSGKVKITGSMINNERNGEWNAYFENGQKWSYGEYSNGQRNGRSLVYNSDGTLKLTGYYKNNNLDSLWVTFKPNGDTAQVTMYRDGEIVSSFYNDNNSPIKKTEKQ